MTELVPPLSKSDAQRALVVAEVLGVPLDSVLPADETLPRDVEVLRAGLLALRELECTIDCRDGGAPFRFLLGQAAVLPGRRVTFTGTPRLGERPHAPLVEALRRAIDGLEVEQGAPWPLVVKTPAVVKPTRFVVDAGLSSQFASSLLLAAARVAAREQTSVQLDLEGTLASEGYFELTKRWLTPFLPLPPRGRGLGRGVTLQVPPKEIELPQVPGDWSSLGYLLALSWASGLPISRLERNTGHPDELQLAHFESAGLHLHSRIITGTPTRGFEVDAAVCPDAVPLLAAVATRLPAPSRFTNVSILKVKESDRLAGVLELLHAAGLRASSDGSTLTVDPGPAHAFTFDARDDHRMAMSAAVLARLHSVPLTLHGRESVAKSFPHFWLEAAKAGVP